MTAFQKLLVAMKQVQVSDSMWEPGLFEPGLFDEEESEFQKILTELKKK